MWSENPPIININTNICTVSIKKTHTSIGNGRDSTVEVFEADHSEATGIQKLGQVLYLETKSSQDSKLVI